MNRLLAISLAALVAVQALLGGGGGGGVLCLGGGHHHSEAETTHCDSACGHESAWPLPVPSENQHDDCGCTDIEFVATDLAAFPKGDGGAEATPDVIAWADPGIVFFRRAHGWVRGAPLSTPVRSGWCPTAREHRECSPDPVKPVCF